MNRVYDQLEVEMTRQQHMKNDISNIVLFCYQAEPQRKGSIFRSALPSNSNLDNPNDSATCG